MNNDFQIELSAEEIFVLAGFLGYETVFGIGEQQSFDFDGELKRKIKAIVKRLERKKLIRYYLDGTLFIRTELKLCIECICEADTIGLFFTNIKTEKNTTIYGLEKNNFFSLVEKNNNGKYGIKIISDSLVSKVFHQTLLNSKVSDIYEKIPYEEAVYIKEHICSFNVSQANTLLRNFISNDKAIPCVLGILSGRGKYLNVQIFRKEKKLYKCTYSRIVAVSYDNSICVSADENDIVNFNATDIKHIYEHIESELGIKRGDV